MYELCEVVLRLPAELRARFRRVADEAVQLSGTSLQRGINPYAWLPVDADVRERALDELADGVVLPRRNDVVAGLVLLQHQPHRLHVVACVAPIATRIEVSEHELVLQAE